MAASIPATPKCGCSHVRRDVPRRKRSGAAEEHFLTVFQQREMPEDIPEKSLDGTLLEEGHIRIVSLLVALGLVSSNGEARRSIAQGAVRINGQKVSADAAAVVAIQEGDVVQVGRRKFAKVTIS